MVTGSTRSVLRTVACVAAVAMCWRSGTEARPMHAGINYQRYLQEKSTVDAELDAWMSKYGEVATTQGLIPGGTSTGGAILHGTANEEGTLGAAASSQDTRKEDHRQRFFMAKTLAEELNQEYKEANFSTDSPFSLMTETEFASYVKNSYLRSNGTATALRSVAGTVKAPEEVGGEADANSDADSSTNAPSTSSGLGMAELQKLMQGMDFNSFKSMIGNVWSMLQGQSGGGAAPSSSRRRLAQTTQQRPSVDWSNSKCMSPVQNQAECGGCWAFATVSSIETGLCLSSGTLTKFSEQHMVSCDGNNYGCDGGSLQDGLRFAARQGLCLAKDYPYRSQGGQTGQCYKCNRYQTGLKHGYVLTSEAQLVKALQSGTVVTAVASGNRVWKQYSSGVVSSCGSTAIDHAIVVVGYTSQYFKIRNSWGPYWGEKGYIRLARGGGNYGTCQLYSNMIQPIVKV